MQFSLKKKFLSLIFAISMICPIVAGIIFYRNASTIGQFKVIADTSLPRSRQMGAVLAQFRQLRIEVRSLAIRGNTEKDYALYLSNINATMNSLLKEKEKLIHMMSQNDEEKAMIAGIEAAWKKFEILGKDILALYQKGDEDSLNQMAVLVHKNCPEIASEFDNSIAKMVEWQTKSDISRTESAMTHSKETTVISLFIALAGIVSSLIVGGLFANLIVNTIKRNIEALTESAVEINGKSEDVEKISSNLSSASTQQAASLQETVASLHEISAMVSRNADNAMSSVRTSEESTVAVKEGKDKVEKMLSSINEIADSNTEIMQQMEKSNREISEIVKVIHEISKRTEVINDIVFQTKLLSFNASVEAARAGEHGKGFAVVAEEVGNLASMSGNAAKEISDLLTKSVKRVEEIVASSKALMNELVQRSQEKIEAGTMTAQECSGALNIIMSNVSRVNELLNEISTASQEQSRGIKEINKAMTELDGVTQQNSSAASEANQTATELKDQVDRLKLVVSRMSGFIEGNLKQNNETTAEVVQLRPMGAK